MPATLGRVSTARSYSVAMIVGVGAPVYCTPEDASCPTAADEVGASDQDLKEAAAEMKGGLSHVSKSYDESKLASGTRVMISATPSDSL